jgi:mannose-6-phosphate isomerase-like protein (cupin superfamily)
MTVSAEQLEQFVRRLVASPELWSDHVRHSDDVRVYEQIWDEDDINAWVICWSEDQDTGFHDHDESGAAIAVISGHVREDRLTVGGPGAISRELGPGEVFTVPPVAIHRVLHAGEAPAVTIHAYSPPLTRTGAYRLGPNGELERESQSFAVELAAGI